jgi:hypothetical protein
MFTSWRYDEKSRDFKFQVAGRLPDWDTYEQATQITTGHISSGLSHDDKMVCTRDFSVSILNYLNAAGRRHCDWMRLQGWRCETKGVFQFTQSEAEFNVQGKEFF